VWVRLFAVALRNWWRSEKSILVRVASMNLLRDGQARDTIQGFSVGHPSAVSAGTMVASQLFGSGRRWLQ
jgi:hypothetical protein